MRRLGEVVDIPAEIVITCIGSRAFPIDNLPFNDALGTVVNEEEKYLIGSTPLVGLSVEPPVLSEPIRMIPSRLSIGWLPSSMGQSGTVVLQLIPSSIIRVLVLFRLKNGRLLTVWRWRQHRTVLHAKNSLLLKK